MAMPLPLTTFANLKLNLIAIFWQIGSNYLPWSHIYWNVKTQIKISYPTDKDMNVNATSCNISDYDLDLDVRTMILY